jgi:lipoate-protein ligase A
MAATPPQSARRPDLATPEVETWLLLRSGAGEPAFNMALDEALLEAAPALGRPVLRFYTWTVPAASFGYSQRHAEVERLTPLRPLIRRPTGGGVVPHAGDWTYTLVFPPGHGWYALRARASYERLHAWLQAAFQRIGLGTELAAVPASGPPAHCFQRAEQFDLLYREAKIAGAAQRRTRRGLLIQGSVQPPAGADRAAWEAALCQHAAETWPVRWQSCAPDAAVWARAEALARDKYRLDAHNRRR